MLKTWLWNHLDFENWMEQIIWMMCETNVWWFRLVAHKVTKLVKLDKLVAISILNLLATLAA